MSEANRSNGNPNCKILRFRPDENKLEIEDAIKHPIDKLGIPPMINMGDNIITNETPDGKTVAINKATGEVIGTLEPDGTLSRILKAKDREKAEEEEEKEAHE